MEQTQDIIYEDDREVLHKRRMKELKVTTKGWLFILPVVVLMAIFTFYPLIRSLITAFQVNYDALNGSFEGWGVANFTRIFSYGKFNYCLINTLLFAFVSVPVSTLLALLISVGLNAIKPLREIYQTLFFLPYLTNSIAIGAVFAAMFSVIGIKGDGTANSWGLINTIFHSEIDWMNVSSTVPAGRNPFWYAVIDPKIWPARIVVLVYEIWAGLPFKILILFGALQNVNKQYYQAAKVDGASKHKTLWKVTVPLISPMLSYLIITGFIGGFKSYTALVGIFGSQKVSNSNINTVVGFIYDNIGSSSTGLAAAAALVLLIIIMVFTFINFLAGKKRVHY